ncbi:MAG: hypothetical protein NVS9B15_15670 [Acidobacteriaceae bacterium]
MGVWQCKQNNPIHRFTMGPNGDIVAQGTNLCAGVTGGSNASGTPLILWDCNRLGNDDQS